MVPVPVPTFEKVTVPVPVPAPAPYLNHIELNTATHPLLFLEFGLKIL